MLRPAGLPGSCGLIMCEMALDWLWWSSVSPPGHSDLLITRWRSSADRCSANPHHPNHPQPLWTHLSPFFSPCIHKAERICSQKALFPISPPAAPLKDHETILHMRCCYLPSLSGKLKQVPLSLNDKHLLLVHYEAVLLLRRWFNDSEGARKETGGRVVRVPASTALLPPHHYSCSCFDPLADSSSWEVESSSSTAH